MKTNQTKESTPQEFDFPCAEARAAFAAKDTGEIISSKNLKDFFAKEIKEEKAHQS
jgi:hypothetical protein